MIDAGAANEDVVAGAAEDVVGQGRADQRIVADAAEDVGVVEPDMFTLSLPAPASTTFLRPSRTRLAQA